MWPDEFSDSTGHLAEILVECIAGLKLCAVDQQRPRPAQLVAVFVEIAEQRQASVLESSGAVLVLPMEP